VSGRDPSAQNSRLLVYERELEIGRQIQSGFLPERLPVPPGWEIEAEFRPARQVAGDFYDVFEIVDGRRIALIVADVCDKGVGAALFMALIRTLLRHSAGSSGLRNVAAVQRSRRPAAAPRGAPAVGAAALLGAVEATNRYLIDTHPKQGYFATLFFGVLDPATGNLVYANCGHNPPMVLTADGRPRAELEPTGPAVGVVPGGVFELGYERLVPGESLFAYTDGVTEAHGADGELFGVVRLRELARGRPACVRDLIDGTLDAIGAHTAGAEQYDDITMLAVRRGRPENPAAADPHSREGH
jgi:sigma-B regulation protein RsbU (phosphoserine phosphatase)